jgi:hypothetical protein
MRLYSRPVRTDDWNSLLYKIITNMLGKRPSSVNDRRELLQSFDMGRVFCPILYIDLGSKHKSRRLALLLLAILGDINQAQIKSLYNNL